MCLILFAYRSHARYQLVLAANRDEYYRRPTAPAGWWAEAPSLLAGKDLEAGGTWLGMTKQGKLAALTNFRDPKPHRQDALSRGKLVSRYLLGTVSGHQYLEELRLKGCDYNGFNLLVGDMESLYYYSNRQGEILPVTPGLYGLSNAFLDTPWPKVVKGKQRLEKHLLSQPEVSLEGIFSLLADVKIAPDDQLPDTGIGHRYERVLSSVFINTPEYGTRSSTVILVDQNNQVTFIEKGFVPPAEKRYRFSLSAFPGQATGRLPRNGNINS